MLGALALCTGAQIWAPGGEAAVADRGRGLLTRYSPWEFIRRVLSTSKGWHRNVAHPPCGSEREQVTTGCCSVLAPLAPRVLAHAPAPPAPARPPRVRQDIRSVGPRPTHSDEAGQEVGEDVVRQEPRGEDQLLGLVVAGELRRGRVSAVLLLGCHHPSPWARRRGPYLSDGHQGPSTRSHRSPGKQLPQALCGGDGVGGWDLQCRPWHSARLAQHPARGSGHLWPCPSPAPLPGTCARDVDRLPAWRCPAGWILPSRSTRCSPSSAWA